MRLSYSHLAKASIYPLGDLALGTNIMEALRELEESQWWTERQTKSLQEEKLGNVLEHAYQNVPYYRPKLDELGVKPSQIAGLDDLQKLPVLTKRDIRDYFPEKLVAKNVSRKEMLPGMTGGSTGRPLQFYRHIHSTSQDWRATLRAWGWAGYQVGDKYTTLWGHPLTLKEQSHLGQRAQNLMRRNLLLSAYDIIRKNNLLSAFLGLAASKRDLTMLKRSGKTDY
jgi:phenylacetate-CoA ligase